MFKGNKINSLFIHLKRHFTDSFKLIDQRLMHFLYYFSLSEESLLFLFSFKISRQSYAQFCQILVVEVN